ncbi:NAD(P)H-hydrate dehydratase, partial [Alphaproteobacteria bacterium]|nr:NAD(P)H-hydrate dehydratase [Alphaproteobacteria bacterium]
NRILTIEQIKESENQFICKNSEEQLLNIAGEKIAIFLLNKFKRKTLLFVCGKGNNGQDGVKASIFLGEKIKNKVFLVSENYSKKNLNTLQSNIKSHEIIVDCLFGTGLNRPLSKFHQKIIEIINKSKKKIISIDIPSGLNSDTGQPLGSSVIAHMTICMGFYKPAHFLIPSKNNCGEKVLLKLPLKSPIKMSPKIHLLKNEKVYKSLPKHNNSINKYDKGHVVVIGGVMSGAARIVAFASRKVGAGLSTILVHPDHLKYYLKCEPGTIVAEYSDNHLLKKDVLVVGPGLGKDYDKNFIKKIILEFEGKIIVDADAISIFENQRNEFHQLIKKKKSLILTPHKGEFKKIFYNSQNKVLDCFNASKLVSNIVLYKGNDTVISSPNGNVWINSNASNSLATAGSGDLLCGIISGLVAQKMKIDKSVLAAVCIQNDLSNRKKNAVVEDFLKDIQLVMNTIKNNN